MPRDGTMPEEDRALIRARQILGRQTSWQQGGWSTCFYAELTRRGIVEHEDRWLAKAGQISRRLGVSMDEGEYLIGLASVPSKCAVLDASLARRGLTVPESPGYRGFPCWVGIAAPVAAAWVAIVVAGALLVPLVSHFW